MKKNEFMRSLSSNVIPKNVIEISDLQINSSMNLKYVIYN